MSSIFEDRERAFESQWAREADMRLKARARAQKRLAEEAAGKAGLSGAEAKAAVRAALKAGFAPEGDAAVLCAIAELSKEEIPTLEARLETYVAEETSSA